MSFIHRNRMWLVPLMGLGCAWGVWNTVSTLTGKPKPKPAVQPSESVRKPESTPVPSGTPATPEGAPGGPPVSAPASSGFQSSASPAAAPIDNKELSLWADLRAMEKAPESLSRTEEMLREGEQPLAAKWMTPVAPPSLSREIWKYLFDRVKDKIEKIGQKKAAVSKPMTLPKLDFVIFHGRAAKGEAWFEGQPYHVGETLQGYYTVKQISQQKVTLSTPEGELSLDTREKVMEEAT